MMSKTAKKMYKSQQDLILKLQALIPKLTIISGSLSQTSLSLVLEKKILKLIETHRFPKMTKLTLKILLREVKIMHLWQTQNKTFNKKTTLNLVNLMRESQVEMNQLLKYLSHSAKKENLTKILLKKNIIIEAHNFLNSQKLEFHVWDYN